MISLHACCAPHEHPINIRTISWLSSPAVQILATQCKRLTKDCQFYYAKFSFYFYSLILDTIIWTVLLGFHVSAFVLQVFETFGVSLHSSLLSRL